MGTPQDLEEYKSWSNAFKGLLTQNDKEYIKPKGSMALPMAGKVSVLLMRGIKKNHL